MTTISERMTAFKALLDTDAMRKSLPVIATVGTRIATELVIGVMIVDEFLSTGYKLAIYNGGDEAEVEATRDRKALIDGLFLADDDTLHVFRADDSSAGWIKLVYGNSGLDVISDYTTNLESNLKTITEYCDSLEHLS